jgi:hypothetical protein
MSLKKRIAFLERILGVEEEVVYLVTGVPRGPSKEGGERKPTEMRIRRKPGERAKYLAKHGWWPSDKANSPEDDDG